MAGLSVGQVVVSKRGKDAGEIYVVVGTTEDRVLLADAKKFNVGRPKPKNSKHLQPTRCIIEEVREKVSAGQDIDRGRFCYLLQQNRKAG